MTPINRWRGCLSSCVLDVREQNAGAMDFPLYEKEMRSDPRFYRARGYEPRACILISGDASAIPL